MTIWAQASHKGQPWTTITIKKRPWRNQLSKALGRSVPSVGWDFLEELGGVLRWAKKTLAAQAYLQAGWPHPPPLSSQKRGESRGRNKKSGQNQTAARLRPIQRITGSMGQVVPTPLGDTPAGAAPGRAGRCGTGRAPPRPPAGWCGRRSAARPVAQREDGTSSKKKHSWGWRRATIFSSWSTTWNWGGAQRLSRLVLCIESVPRDGQKKRFTRKKTSKTTFFPFQNKKRVFFWKLQLTCHKPLTWKNPLCCFIVFAKTYVVGREMLKFWMFITQKKIEFKKPQIPRKLVFFPGTFPTFVRNFSPVFLWKLPYKKLLDLKWSKKVL